MWPPERVLGPMEAMSEDGEGELRMKAPIEARRVALNRLDASCERGEGAACRLSGLAWMQGRVSDLLPESGAGGSPFARGMVKLTAGCAAGDGLSCWEEARRYLKGLGTPIDEAAARRVFGLGCAAGHLESCVDEGLLAEKGRGGAADPARAEANYAGACEAGDGRGCTKLGLVRQAADGAEGLRLLERGCELKFEAGCGLAVIALETGKGVPVDLSRRALRLADGIVLGDKRAMELLARATPDLDGSALAAVELRFAQACVEGAGLACSAQGALGGADDVARVGGLYLRACQLGDPVGCGKAAVAVEAGLLVAPEADLPEWRERGCDAGVAEACTLAADQHVQGVGDDGPDLAAARRYFLRGCELNQAASCDGVRWMGAAGP